MSKLLKLISVSVGISLLFSLKLGVTEIVTIGAEGGISISSPYSDDIDLLRANAQIPITAEEEKLINDLIIKNNMWFMNNAKRLVEERHGLQKTIKVELDILFWIVIVSSIFLLLITINLRNISDILTVMSLPLLLIILDFFNVYQFTSVLVVVCATLLIKFLYVRGRNKRVYPPL